jgi:hypothetical protein
MAIDPNLILQSVAASKTPYIDPNESALRAQQVRGLGLQNQMQAASLQRMNQLRELAAQSDFSTPEGRQAYLGQVAKVDPQQAVKMGQEWAQGDLATQKAFHENMKSKLEQASAARSYVGQVAGGITDQASYDAGLGTLRNYAAKIGDQDLLNELNQAPKVYDPNFVQREKTMALTGAQQAEQQMKAHQLAIEQLKAEGANLSPVGKIERDFKAGLIDKATRDAAIKKETSFAPNAYTFLMGGMGGGGAAGGASPSFRDQVDATKAAIKEGRMPWPKGRDLSDPILSTAIREARVEDPTLNESTHAQRAKTQQAFTTGQQGNSMRAGDIAIQHAGELMQTFQELGNQHGAWLNAPANKLSTLFGTEGSDKLAAAQANIEALAHELTKFYSGSGGSQGEVEAFKRELSLDRSLDQQKATLGRFIKLMGGGINGYQNQYRRAMGPVGGELQVLSPESLATLQKIQAWAGGKSPQQAATPAPAAPPPGTRSQLSNLHTDGKRTIGWDGSKWVDTATGQEVK